VEGVTGGCDEFGEEGVLVPVGWETCAQDENATDTKNIKTGIFLSMSLRFG